MFWRAEQNQTVRPVAEELRTAVVDVDAAPGGGMSLGDILFILFRRKWLILACTALGLGAAAYIYFVQPPVYVSEAKLLIRYVVERKTVNATSPDSQIKSPDSRGSDIVASEAAILSSFDLARAVAEIVTPEKLVPRSGSPAFTVDRAAARVADGLKVEVPRNSSIISLSFRHGDPEVVQPVLTNLISIYLQKHVEVHRGASSVDEFIASQADQLKAELARTESDLQNLLHQAGVLSLEEGRKAYSDQLARIQSDLRESEARLAERQAALQKMVSLGNSSSNQVETSTFSPVPTAISSEYRSLLAQIEVSRKEESELLTKFTEDSKLVAGVRERLQRLEARRAELEKSNPQLVTTTVAGTAGGPVQDPNRELIEIAALEAKVRALQQQAEQVKTESAKLDRVESNISQLQRDRVALETNYHYLKASLRQARFDDALGPGKVSNIYPILHPTPPAVDAGKKVKIAGGAAGGGLALGLGLAFLLEMLVDRRIKRGIDIQAKLRLPLFLSIPRLKLTVPRATAAAAPPAAPALPAQASPPGATAASAADPVPPPPSVAPPAAAADPEAASQEALRSLFKRRTNGALKPLEEPAPQPSQPAGVSAADAASQPPLPPMTWHGSSPLRPYSEALRDRLITHFDARNIAHKPKLVAVTGCNPGSGVSSVATGLAAALSETGEGKVLLVDLSLERGAAHPFYEGRPVMGMSEALEQGRRAGQAASLCIATTNEGSPGGDLPAILPRSFRQLVPRLKTSDFDYIIFDMPPVDETSVTPRLSSFVDLVVMVVESEQTQLEAARKASWLLSQVNVEVACVLNKQRDYLPKALQHGA